MSKKSSWKLELIEASNVAAKDIGGTSDPFCEVFLVNFQGKETEKIQSPTKSSTLHPKWNFLVYNKTNFAYENYQYVRVYLWDRDVVGRDSLGKVDIEFSEICKPGVNFISKPITPVKEKKKKSSISGTLIVRSTFQSDVATSNVQLIKKGSVDISGRTQKTITICSHGWNDNPATWRKLVPVLKKRLGDVYFFEYNSLSDEVTLENLAEDLHAFIWHKLSETQVKSDAKKLNEIITVNLMCYSTSALLFREFLNKFYYKYYKGVIQRLLFVAGANGGSPYAKKGNTGIGKFYVGQKSNLNSLFSHGHNLLNALECCSPFIYGLADRDLLVDLDAQYFHPDKILTTVLQGCGTYAIGMKSRLTRGDMTGTDGTVCLSGSGLGVSRVDVNADGVAITSSTAQVAHRLVEDHHHRTVITNLFDLDSEMYKEVIAALTCTRDSWEQKRVEYEAERQKIERTSTNMANLINFCVPQNDNLQGNPISSLRLEVYVHNGSESLEFGKPVPKGLTKLSSKQATHIFTAIGLFNTHNKSPSHGYYIMCERRIRTAMESAPSTKGKHICLAFRATGADEAFVLGNSAEKHFFNKLPVLASTQIVFNPSVKLVVDDLKGLLSSGAAVSSVKILAAMKKESDIDEAISNLSIEELRKLFIFAAENRSAVLTFLCENCLEELRAETEAKVVAVLTELLETHYAGCDLVVEAIGVIILQQTAEEVQIAKNEYPFLGVNLHKLIYKVLNKSVPYTLEKGSGSRNLSPLVAAHVYNSSVALANAANKPTGKVRTSAMQTKVIYVLTSFDKSQKFCGIKEFVNEICPIKDSAVVVLPELPVGITSSAQEFVLQHMSGLGITNVDLLIGNDTETKMDATALAAACSQRITEYSKLWSEWNYIVIAAGCTVASNMVSQTLTQHAASSINNKMFFMVSNCSEAEAAPSAVGFDSLVDIALHCYRSELVTIRGLVRLSSTICGAIIEFSKSFKVSVDFWNLVKKSLLQVETAHHEKNPRHNKELADLIVAVNQQILRKNISYSGFNTLALASRDMCPVKGENEFNDIKTKEDLEALCKKYPGAAKLLNSLLAFKLPNQR